MKYIKANTLSVILSDSKSVFVGVKLGKEYTNLTLRFDQGPTATLCGYSQDWRLHNEPVYEDGETEETFEQIIDEIEFNGVYVSKQDEIRILKQLKRAIQRQFADPAWADCCPTNDRMFEILWSIDAAIAALN